MWIFNIHSLILISDNVLCEGDNNIQLIWSSFFSIHFSMRNEPVFFKTHARYYYYNQQKSFHICHYNNNKNSTFYFFFFVCCPLINFLCLDVALIIKIIFTAKLFLRGLDIRDISHCIPRNFSRWASANSCMYI